MNLFISLIFLFVSISGATQSIGKWTVSATSAATANDSILVVGGQPGSGMSTSPTSFSGFLPLNYSLLSIPEFGLEFMVYPNPTNDYVIVRILTAEAGAYTAKIYDQIGTLVLSDQLISNSSSSSLLLGLNSLSAGTYLLVLEFDHKVVGSQSIIFAK